MKNVDTGINPSNKAKKQGRKRKAAINQSFSLPLGAIIAGSTFLENMRVLSTTSTPLLTCKHIQKA